VLARAGDDAIGRRARRKRPQQRPGALVRAVLAPHHAEHRELELGRGAAAKAVADRVELVVGDAQAAVERLFGHRRRLDRQGHRVATNVGPPARSRSAADATNEAMIPSPSADPRTASTAVSGCGIRPATLPAALMTPAIARREPFGLARSSSPPARTGSSVT